jgi:hypothetical protein
MSKKVLVKLVPPDVLLCFVLGKVLHSKNAGNLPIK